MAKPKVPIPVPEDLTIDEQRALWAWVQKRHPHLGKWRVRQLVDQCLSHWAAKGNPKGYHDFEKACRNWISKEEVFEQNRRNERPQERREPLRVIRGGSP